MTEQASQEQRQQAEQQIDPYLARARANAEKGAMSHDVLVLKMVDSFSFLLRNGLDRQEALSLAQHAITSEIDMMRVHVEARRVVTNDGQEAVANS